MIKLHGENVNIELKRGISLVVGENGSGKSTFFKQILKGEVEISWDDVVIEKSEIGMFISQINQTHNIPDKVKVLDLCEMVIPDISIEDIKELAKELFCEQLLIKNNSFGSLSGGEKQKIKFILSWFQNKSILLIDELDNNLDSDTINVVRDKLIKSDKYILLITHDIEYYEADAISKIEVTRSSITQISSGYSVDANGIEKKSGKVEKERNFTGFNKYYRGPRLVMVLLVFIFSLVVSTVFIVNYVKLDFGFKDPTYNSVSSIVTAPIESPLFYTLGDQAWIDSMFYFTEEEYEHIKKLDYIQDIVPIGSITNIYNNIAYLENGKQYELAQKEFIYDQSLIAADLQSEYASANINLYSDFNLEFMGLTLPNAVYSNTPYNIGIDLFAGDYPEDESNQVLISVDLANYLSQNEGLDNPSKLIGTSYDVKLDELDGIKKTGESITEKFEISGIYYNQMEANNENIIYSYKSKQPVAKQNNCGLETEQEEKQYCMYNVYGKVGGSDEKFRKLVDEDGLGQYGAFYIEVTDEEDLKQLTEYMREIDPNIYVDNNYVRTEEFSTPVVRKALSKLILKLFIIELVFMLVLFLLNKRKNNILKEINAFIDDYNLCGKSIRAYLKRNLTIDRILFLIASLLGYSYFLVSAVLSFDTIAIAILIGFIIFQNIIFIYMTRRKNEKNNINV